MSEFFELPDGTIINTKWVVYVEKRGPSVAIFFPNDKRTFVDDGGKIYAYFKAWASDITSQDYLPGLR